MDADLQAQLNELNAGIADLIEADSSAAVAQTLAAMLEVMKSRVREEPPTVIVNVAPTPIQNTVNVPAQMPDCCFEHEYNHLGQIVRSRMTRVKS